jgi:endonuclease YncB( thermonuclease family)
VTMNTFRRVHLMVLAILIAVRLSACSEQTAGQGYTEPKQAAQGQPRTTEKPPEAKSEFNAKPRTVPKKKIAEDDVKAYYDAASRGDYAYTYEHLSEADRLTFTQEDWISANQSLQSDQATYEITDVRKAGLGRYEVELTVNGEPRTTRFVSESGIFKHELTGNEFIMFNDALYSASASASASSAASVAPEPSSGNTVTVVDVVDGDTFDIDRSIQGMDRVRLIGVDTPEVYGGEEPCGQEASDFTTERLQDQQVTLEIGEDPEDPYGRLLAYVFVGNEFYNETLVLEGLADAVSYPPNTKYDAQLEAAEATAKTPVCSGDGSASASASASASTSPSASASPNPPGHSNSKLNNGADDVNCEDLAGPVTIVGDDEDQLDANNDGIGCN